MENEMQEMVSIIVPVYNAQAYIEETIKSVWEQTYTNWELLLVENGSKDESKLVIKRVIKKYNTDKIKLIESEENIGAARARNLGLSMAKGRFIAYLDADDIWRREKLWKEITFLREKNAGFVFTGYEFGDEFANGTGKIVRVPETLTYKQALGNTTIFTTTVMFDTQVIPKELLNMPVIKSEDTALWWKILRSGYTAYGLDENLVIYRRAGKTLSSNKLEAIRRIWNLYRNAEGMGIFKSSFYFCVWAYNAVKRRV